MEASYYEALAGGKVRCLLCPNYCIISESRSGGCRIRSNKGGKLQADAYGKVVTIAVDPIEKKPLYHFYPSKPILSTGPSGCNFQCGFCQNYGISQFDSRTEDVSPEELVSLAEKAGSVGIAYTYTEPFIWFEYVRDAGRLAKEKGLMNVLVTNGYVNVEPLKELLPLIDAMNVDIKSMRPEFYTKICGGKLDEVLRTVELSVDACHIEITNLVITNYNDTDEDIRKLVDWVASIDPGIPLHFSRYFPQYKFIEPPTSKETLKRAYELASEKLKYVYVGNIDIPGTNDTKCPVCGNTLVSRNHYHVGLTGIRGGLCGKCSSDVDIIGL